MKPRRSKGQSFQLGDRAPAALVVELESILAFDAGGECSNRSVARPLWPERGPTGLVPRQMVLATGDSSHSPWRTSPPCECVRNGYLTGETASMDVDTTAADCIRTVA